MSEIERVPLESLVLDWNLYPRHEVDGMQVARLAEAIEAGEELPPLHICRESRRIVDGFHRYHAYRRCKVKMVAVTARDFTDEPDLLVASVTANARHGVPLAPIDRARVIGLADSVGLSREKLAMALAVRISALERVERRHMGKTRRGPIWLKPAVRHYAGRQVPASIVAINETLTGSTAAHLLRQVIGLMKSGGLDMQDETVRSLLEELREALGDLAVAA